MGVHADSYPQGVDVENQSCPDAAVTPRPGPKTFLPADPAPPALGAWDPALSLTQAERLLWTGRH